MALAEALGFTTKELCNMGCEIGGGGDGRRKLNRGREVATGKRGSGSSWDTCCSSMLQNFDDWDVDSWSPKTGSAAVCQEGTADRRKRRRTKRFKNKEEVETQRMTHIAVERNRRRLMNEYLAVLRSLMPASYVQKGDQASIVGGAINFVKELEQSVQSLEAQKRIRERSKAAPFADFFTFPQYSSSSSHCTSTSSTDTTATVEAARRNPSAMADIEVTIVESHANVKIFSRWRPRQLLMLVLGLQNLRLTTLHLNVTTVDEMVLYCFSLKVEDDCQCASVDVIATAVHQIIARIEEEETAHH
ncbi:unnamed protein product [Musa acuminata subsp. malaccensis]|uniref:(wild Malaysian banana) hypothetical protein n=1 Tax=Musa acuminata subsp. malaccensis TaxID=214687 RepID=A0A804KJI3_MUSAM|nr:PREDICTED: transcription factor bHLH94-like isoform X1 [Musa acuminata subsp. malaccensis]CAG1835173.1 unnamed protein product [Musa acuminata subsp. malaccensis]